MITEKDNQKTTQGKHNVTCETKHYCLWFQFGIDLL